MNKRFLSMIALLNAVAEGTQTHYDFTNATFEFDDMEKENKAFEKRREYSPKMQLSEKETERLASLSGSDKKKYLKQLKNQYGI